MFGKGKRMALVYLSRIPESVHVRPLGCPVRDSYLEAIPNPARRAESYLSWLLLMYVLDTEYGVDLTHADVRRTPEGRWYAADVPYSFSLSHTREFVACAVSEEPVGVDIERADRIGQRDADAFLARFFHPGEREKDLHPVLAWSLKESVFKAGQGRYRNLLEADASTCPFALAYRWLSVGEPDTVLTLAGGSLKAETESVKAVWVSEGELERFPDDRI